LNHSEREKKELQLHVADIDETRRINEKYKRAITEGENARTALQD
jgi:hypothetical protein